nr:hypothetical transcript [Hymenolepis microstoma]
MLTGTTERSDFHIFDYASTQTWTTRRIRHESLVFLHLCITLYYHLTATEIQIKLRVIVNEWHFRVNTIWCDRLPSPAAAMHMVSFGYPVIRDLTTIVTRDST